MKQKLKNVTESTKTHFVKHKVLYISGSSALISLGVGYAIGSKHVSGGIHILADNNEGVVVGINNGTINQLVSRGHRGYEILCNESGESWASLRRAAEVAGVSPSKMREHLKGLVDNLNGKTYTNLGEYLD